MDELEWVLIDNFQGTSGLIARGTDKEIGEALRTMDMEELFEDETVLHVMVRKVTNA